MPSPDRTRYDTPIKRRAFKVLLFLLVFLTGGAIINIAVAWGCFPGQPDDWRVIENNLDIDQSHLTKLGLPEFQSVDSDMLRSFGFVDSDYSTFVDPNINKYQFVYARETSCGWPLLSLHGIRWGPITYSENLKHHVFTQEHIRITAIHLSDVGDKVILGEREFLPYGPLWPGFAINTLFYAVILWLFFAAPFTLRRWRRVRKGLCPKCAYPVGISDTCTECGKPVRSP